MNKENKIFDCYTDGIIKRLFSQVELENLSNRVMQIPMMTHMCAQFSAHNNGIVEVKFNEIKPFHLGGIERPVLNGAAILGLVDCALVTPAILHFDGAVCATVEISVRIMKSVAPKDLKAIGYAVSKSRHLAYTDAKILDHNNRVCVTASGVISRA